jgi:hypothetical protein
VTQKSVEDGSYPLENHFHCFLRYCEKKRGREKSKYQFFSSFFHSISKNNGNDFSNDNYRLLPTFGSLQCSLKFLLENTVFGKICKGQNFSKFYGLQLFPYENFPETSFSGRNS